MTSIDYWWVIKMMVPVLAVGYGLMFLAVWFLLENIPEEDDQ